MPRIAPFPALRYRPGHDPFDVTAPPYDVISEKQSEELKRQPFNFAHLTLPGADGYERSGSLLRKWRNDSVLQQHEAAFYVYSTTYAHGGSQRTTAGLIAALELEPFGQGGIYPHEKTMPGPKADRLSLMRTTRANLEPLWFFTAEPLPALQDLLRSTDEQDPLYNFSVGEAGHRMWRVPASLGADVAEAIAETSLVIADGHHRYETAIAFAKEQEGAGPWDSTLALIADREFRPPTVMPIHRLVRGASASRVFELAQVQELPEAALLERMSSAGPGTIGVVWPEGSGWFKTDGMLDTRFLAEKVLSPLGWSPEYEHDLDGVLDAGHKDSVAFLMAPVGTGSVAELALRGHTMPPKTTLFIPKPRSGLLLRDLDQG